MRAPLFVHICTFCRAFRYCQAVQTSKREVECLKAAMGKTDIEISMIIKRSRATVLAYS